MSEVEFKFHIPVDQRAALQAVFMEREPTQVHLLARYFDTDAGALARAGMSLRVRREGTQWVQALKVRGNDPAARLEHEAPVVPPPSGEPSPDVALHKSSPAGKRLAGLLSADDTLREVHRTDVVRHVLSLHQGGATVEVALDVGHVEAAGKTLLVHEIEFELKQGEPADLVAVARPWVEQFGLWLDVVAKGERAQLLAQGRRHAPPARATPPADLSIHPQALVRRVVAACLDQVLRNGSEVAAGSADPDHVHQMRVGLRRLRTALRELAPLDAGLDPGWEAPLAATFRELGRHRDQALLDSKTGIALRKAGAPPLRTHATDTPATSVEQAVVSTPLQMTLLALLGYSMAADMAPASPRQVDAVRAIADRLDQLHRRVRKNARRFTELPADDQHAVRKRLKRLRYLAEFVAPVFRHTHVKAYFDHLRPAQDALGDHNDEATALAHFQALTAAEAQAWFAVGWLTARQPRSARASAKALRAAVRAKPFWHRRPARRAKATT